MLTLKRRLLQSPLWIFTLYTWVNQLVSAEKVDEFAEDGCKQFYGSKRGQSSVPPDTCFRSVLAGWFDGVDSESGFVGLGCYSFGVCLILGKHSTNATSVKPHFLARPC